MREEETKIWAWVMPSGNIYKVVSNPVDGTICLYDPDGKLVKKHEKLSKAEVTLIEKNFLETVATMVSGKETETGEETKKDMADGVAIYIR